MSRTAIVVVTHNSAGVVGLCLEACRRAAPAAVVVVDNASADSTVAEALRFPAVRVIRNGENRGFAAAVNQGVRATAEPFVLLLNPDTELEGGLAELERACEAPGVAAAAGLLVGEDGAPQRGFSVRRLPTAAALAFETLGLNRVWPSNPVNRRYRCLDLDLTAEQDVEQPAGAFLMFRRDAWEGLGGFDEDFHPVWFEDVDFCRRLKNKGLRVRLVPAARARHGGGHSFQYVSRQNRIAWWYISLLKYASRHLRAGACGVVGASVVLGAALKMVTGMSRGAGRVEAIRAYGRVIRFVLSGRWTGPRNRVAPAGAQAAKGPDGELNPAREMRH